MVRYTFTLIVQDVITNSNDNNQIGIGYFVDKPIVPYVSVEPNQLVVHMPVLPSFSFIYDSLSDSCQAAYCQPTFDYRNSLSLTTNGSAFEVCSY